MARSNRMKQSRTPFLSSFRSLGVVLIAFVMGYEFSTLNISSLLEWLTAGKQALSPKKGAHSVARDDSAKPKLEFYTLLTKDQDVVSLPSKTPTLIANVPAGILRASPDIKDAKPVISAKSDTSSKSIVVVEAKPVATLKPPAPVMQKVAPKGAYLIQLAAFRARQDAEKMKATLVIKGFDVRVTASAPGSNNWYRVMIGPYASKDRATQALGSLAKTQHVTGMIRFVDV